MKLDWLWSIDVYIRELDFPILLLGSTLRPLDTDFLLRVFDAHFLFEGWMLFACIVEAPFEGFRFFFDFKGNILGYLLFLSVTFTILAEDSAMVFPNEACLGTFSLFIYADLDFDLDLDLRKFELFLDVDLKFDGAPPDRYEYFDTLSALIFWFTLLCYWKLYCSFSRFIDVLLAFFFDLDKHLRVWELVLFFPPKDARVPLSMCLGFVWLRLICWRELNCAVFNAEFYTFSMCL